MKSKSTAKRRLSKKRPLTNGVRKRKSVRRTVDVTFDEYEKKSTISEGLYVPDGWL